MGTAFPGKRDRRGVARWTVDERLWPWTAGDSFPL